MMTERTAIFRIEMLDNLFKGFVVCAMIVGLALSTVSPHRKSTGRAVPGHCEASAKPPPASPESRGRSMPGEPSVAARVPAKAAPSKLLVGPEERAKKIVKITWIITAIAILVGLVWAMKLSTWAYGSWRPGPDFRVVKKTKADKVWYVIDERWLWCLWDHYIKKFDTEEEARKDIEDRVKRRAPTISEVLVSNNPNQGEEA